MHTPAHKQAPFTERRQHHRIEVTVASGWFFLHMQYLPETDNDPAMSYCLDAPDELPYGGCFSLWGHTEVIAIRREEYFGAED